MAANYTSTSAIGGAGSGAATGFSVGGPPGAVIGGGLGLLMGAQAGGAEDEANRRRDAAMAEARQRLQTLQRQAWDMRQANTQQALGYWQPTIDKAHQLFGFNAPAYQPQAFPGGTMPGGPPPGPQGSAGNSINGAINHLPATALGVVKSVGNTLKNLPSDNWNQNGLTDPLSGAALGYAIPGYGQVKLGKDALEAGKSAVNKVRSWF